jgi:uncharacterized protein YecT (DUF1311 family)
MLRGGMVFFLAVSLGWAAPVRAQSQGEMNATAAAELGTADAALNALYQKILADRAKNPGFCTDLREAQRAWLKFVDYHLKTVFPLKPGENPREVYGSMYSLDFAVMKTELIEQRVEQLKVLVKLAEER